MRWELYPRVFEHELAKAWLSMQHNLRLAPNTVEAYARSLEDYLRFCGREGVVPEQADREHVARYVGDLASRPNPRSPKVLNIASGSGLSNATMQLRLTAVRLFYDHLIEQGLRKDNPVGRGRYTPGKAFAGKRDRGLVRRYQSLPWIPGDEEWRTILEAAREEPIRNQLMLLLSYDGALRREELVSLEIGDLDFPYRQVRVRRWRW
jgi:site-specific recombinase XerD